MRRVLWPVPSHQELASSEVPISQLGEELSGAGRAKDTAIAAHSSLARLARAFDRDLAAHPCAQPHPELYLG